MSLQALEILNLVQLCLQPIVLWLLLWFVRFAPMSPTPKFTWILGPIFLAALSAPPASLFGIALSRSQTWLYGLGCTVSTLETSLALVFVTIWCNAQVFKPEVLGEGHPTILTFLSILGLVVSILGVVTTALKQLEVGFILAGLGLSCTQLVCSRRANGQKADLLQGFVWIILIAEVVAVMVCFLVAVSRKNAIEGSDPTSQCVWALSQVGIWGQAVIVDCETLLDRFCGSRWRSTILRRLVSRRTSFSSTTNDPLPSLAAHTLGDDNASRPSDQQAHDEEYDIGAVATLSDDTLSDTSFMPTIRLHSVHSDDAQSYWGSEDGLTKAHVLASISGPSHATDNIDVDTFDRPISQLPDREHAPSTRPCSLRVPSIDPMLNSNRASFRPHMAPGPPPLTPLPPLPNTRKKASDKKTVISAASTDIHL